MADTVGVYCRYRGRIRETIFVFGALGLHVISGICGRAVKNVDRKRRVRRNKGVASSAAVGEDEMVAGKLSRSGLSIPMLAADVFALHQIQRQSTSIK